MRSGFISLLFFAILGFGIWFQQTYMGVYSQEFEMQLHADRSQTEVLGAFQVEVRKYQMGVHASTFLSEEIRILNNGNIAAAGNIKLLLYKNGSEIPQVQHVTNRMLGRIAFANAGPSLLGDRNRIEYLLFPNKVTTHSMADTVITKNIRYEPNSGIISSDSPLNWTGSSRVVNAGGFNYNSLSGDISFTGPLNGNFLPTKQDALSFTKPR